VLLGVDDEKFHVLTLRAKGAQDVSRPVGPAQIEPA
jgi:hypothetical protein